MHMREALMGGLIAASLNGGCPAAGLDATAEEARELFKRPTREYSTVPLWVWNDDLTTEQITDTMRDLHDQHVYQVMVHPRPGLATPYMSEKWMELWRTALRTAEQLEMKVWIYDENSYPSGFAGGLVPEEMPESRQVGLVFVDEPEPSALHENTLGVYQIDDGKAEEISWRIREGEAFTTGTYVTVRMEEAGSSPWFANRYYVDLLRREVTDKFFEVTLEPYRKNFGSMFGTLIPGIFTDEPNIRIHHLAWTPQMPALFKERWGYDLLPHLASLHQPIGDFKRVRHNYFQLLNELFMANWAIPYYQYCAEHGLEQTGHYWDHEWPNVGGVPDNMAAYAFQQRPAIDCLMNKFSEETHGQFGNSRMVRELASVANQTDRSRTLCETFGAGGWDLRMEDVKRIADWLAVLGVNTFNEHFSLISMRGARKRDHPQSFSYHNSWFSEYHRVADYMTRLSVAMSQGRQVNRIVVLEPTTTAFLHQATSHIPEGLKKLGEEFYGFHKQLERAQVPYDLLSEYVLETSGTVTGSSLRVGLREYDTLIIPPATENLNVASVRVLEKFAAAGGKIVNCAKNLSLVEGREGNLIATLAEQHNWEQMASTKLLERLSREGSRELQVNWKPGDGNGILFHQRRQLKDADLLLLVNSSITERAVGSWTSEKWNSAEEWDLETGETRPALFSAAASGLRGEFNLRPAGSLLLLLSDKNVQSRPAASETTTVVPLQGDISVQRLQPNVLTLNFVDLKTGDELTTGMYHYEATAKVFRKFGLPANPWEKAVQFSDEIIRRTFPPESGFEVTYRFRIHGTPPPDLAVVVERPDLYTISFNGQPVKASDEWWLDKQFLKVPLAGKAKEGENELTLRARPLTVWHEIEPVYVLGSFSLESTDHGFQIVPQEPLKLGSWRDQGLPFYAWEVAYRQNLILDEDELVTNASHLVQLGDWLGSAARVLVNGKPAGTIAWAPWSCDITKLLKPGENEIEVQVIGTLKNTLGPHHGGKIRGSAWPANFHASPASGPPAGRAYDLIDYGLFEPFRVIKQTTGR